MFRVIRIYNNGSRVVLDFRSEGEMDAHLEYSIHARFGCAHFRNGVCVSRGYLDQELCNAIQSSLTQKQQS